MNEFNELSDKVDTLKNNVGNSGGLTIGFLNLLQSILYKGLFSSDVNSDIEALSSFANSGNGSEKNIGISFENKSIKFINLSSIKATVTDKILTIGE